MLYRHLADSAQHRREYLGIIPHSAALGLEITLADLNRCVLRLPFRAELADAGHGGLANGAVSALLDNAGGVAVFCALDAPADYSTLSLRVEFIAPPASGADVYARVECVRLEGRQAHIRGVADCGSADRPGAPFATVSGVFFIKPDSRPLRDFGALGNV
ncbi:PaaI family thioesterase [Immundisolibacter sp.]|uniref:PaaI family thioesterase n=1 Tax=Immundisolibacter sp. TaxID=1934948 RepID=UPI0026056DBA|nr:PaaI family thioesterase [Immundisolibacter sp.]MDD3650033.1 PaaI family thioesterase [Immundisolibacter sp.]